MRDAFTKFVSGVEKSQDASDEIREELQGLYSSSKWGDRYLECSGCSSLKEEFKLFGKTVKNRVPVCGECGCLLKLKVPISFESCPKNKW